MNVATGAAVAFNASQHLAALNVRGGTATLAAGSGRTLVTRGLSVTDGGVLDLTDNDLALDYAAGHAALANVSALIAAGVQGGSDSRIVSSVATDGLTTLGVADAASVIDFAGAATASWKGQTVDATTVLVKYTYAGDANLDGVVSGDDYSAIDFNILVPNSFGWSAGDFNYDGVITGDDYSAIDFALLAQGAPL